MRPPGDAAIGEPGPSGAPEEAWYSPDGPQQQQQQPGFSPQQQPQPQQQPGPGDGGGAQQNGNVLEWQRRQSGAHREQLAPDPQWPRRGP